MAEKEKKMTRLENGLLNIGDRASGFGLNLKGRDFAFCLKNVEIIQLITIAHYSVREGLF